MRTLKEAIEEAREHFTKYGLTEVEVRRELAVVAKRQVLARMATEAFDKGVPIDQGPVWFGNEAWKTDIWRHMWQCRNAYCEGEAHKAKFGDRDDNPYQQSGLPMSTAKIALEYYWNDGFDSKEF